MDTENVAPTVICSNPDCRVAQDGRCVEGVPDTKSCSHYGKPLVIVEAAKLELSKAPTRPSVRLPSAEALPAAAAETVLRDRLCNVIGIIGPHESGKTSLIGGIYDLLMDDLVGKYAFAGSSTLHAFERAVHDSRTTSNRDDPHMERTERGPATYFHLDLSHIEGRQKLTALFANRDGEAYMETQTNPDLAIDFPELSRCDTLTVLADGVKLMDDSERHQVLNDVCLTIRAFNESKQTRQWQRLAIVLTKIDAVRNADDRATTERALRHFERIVADVCTEFSERFQDIQSFQVSASPKEGMGERGEGMEKLLAYWMKVPGRYSHMRRPQEPTVPARAFGRLRSADEGGDNA